MAPGIARLRVCHLESRGSLPGFLRVILSRQPIFGRCARIAGRTLFGREPAAAETTAAAVEEMREWRGAPVGLGVESTPTWL